MPRGRKPGYKHSPETKEKIRQARQGKSQASDTREKISRSLEGKSKSTEHRNAIADSMQDLEGKCMRRFLSLRAEYPGHEDFFDAHQRTLLLAMREVKTEKELRDIRKYFETATLDNVPAEFNRYQYSSSSHYAQEDAMIELLDAATFLRKILGTKDENPTIH